MCKAKATAAMMRNAIGFVVDLIFYLFSGGFEPEEENSRALLDVSSRVLEEESSAFDNKGIFIILYE